MTESNEIGPEEGDCVENNAQQNLADAMYQQREEQRRHYTYDEELLQYAMLRDGDPGAVEESSRIFRSLRTL